MFLGYRIYKKQSSAIIAEVYEVLNMDSGETAVQSGEAGLLGVF
jgi:hypothetical protein